MAGVNGGGGVGLAGEGGRELSLDSMARTLLSVGMPGKCVRVRGRLKAQLDASSKGRTAEDAEEERIAQGKPSEREANF